MKERDFSQYSIMGGVMVNSLGEVSTERLGRCAIDNKLKYGYFEVEPLKIALEDATMRSRFEAELRNDPIIPKCDIQPDLLAALYGEPSDWCFVLCHWTASFVIFHLANKAILEQEYPTDEDLRHLVLYGYKYGLVELCVPVYCLGIEDADPLEFAVNVTAKMRAYKSLRTLAYSQNSFVEAVPRSDAEEPKLFHLSYEDQRRISAEYDTFRCMDEEG